MSRASMATCALGNGSWRNSTISALGLRLIPKPCLYKFSNYPIPGALDLRCQAVSAGIIFRAARASFRRPSSREPLISRGSLPWRPPASGGTDCGKREHGGHEHVRQDPLALEHCAQGRNLRVLHEPGATLSAVVRWHGLSPGLLYRWRSIAPDDRRRAVPRFADLNRERRHDLLPVSVKREIFRT